MSAVAALPAVALRTDVTHQKREIAADGDARASALVAAFVPHTGVSVGVFTEWRRLLTSVPRTDGWFERDDFLVNVDENEPGAPSVEAALPRRTAGVYELALAPGVGHPFKKTRPSPIVIYGGETANIRDTMLVFTRTGRNIANLLIPYLEAGFELHGRWMLVTGGSKDETKQTVENLEKILQAEFDYAFVSKNNGKRRTHPVWEAATAGQFIEILPSIRALSRDTQAAASMSSSSTTLSPLELAKQKAAHQAVDEHVKSGMRVGIGSGSTVVYAVQRLGQRKQDEEGFEITCVPSSFQATQLITDAGLTLSDLSRTPELDVALDGADEVDSALNCIKGGGGCMLQEKLVISCAERFIVVADQRKDSAVLGTQWTKGIPIEVIPGAWVPVSAALKKLGGKPTLRMAVRKAGPVLTDNANFIIDADFGQVPPEKVAALDAQLQAIVGVVETGLFVGRAEKAYFGQEDGSVKTRSATTSAATAETTPVDAVLADLMAKVKIRAGELGLSSAQQIKQ